MSKTFQGCFKKISQKVLRVFLKSFSEFFFQFVCCIDLIAATRAKGGLVLIVFRTRPKNSLQDRPAKNSVSWYPSYQKIFELQDAFEQI